METVSFRNLEQKQNGFLQFCETTVYIKNISMKQTAENLNEMQIQSLPAGGA